MNSDLTIEVENSSGVKQGSGPIDSASSWSYTARMSATGSFSFTMPATDVKAAIIQKKRIARAYAILNNLRVEVGAGIIDKIEKVVGADGNVTLRVSGQDLLRELNYRTVLDLKLYLGGNPVTHSQAVAAVFPYAPAGWTFTPDATPPNDLVYGYFNGETALAAVVKIAQKSQNQFYRGTGRTLIFASSFTPSGVRAINAQGDLASHTCAITSLSEQVDTTDLLTRIYPRGSGNAAVQLTLRASDRVMPSGYTMNTSQNFIENEAAKDRHGRIEKQVDFRDIGPIENTAGDIVSAANMLADSALETLRRQSTEIEQAVYTLGLAGCSQLLRPMQSIGVAYHDPETATAINATLNILEATWSVSEAGIYTTAIKVSNSDRWPASDRSTLVASFEEGKLYQALPQLSANEYVTSYNKNVDKDHIGGFRFRLGNAITQLRQVFFEFQLLPFESTVKSVGGASGGSGNLPTTGPSTDTSGSPDNDTSGAPSTNTSSAPSTNTSGVSSASSTGVPSVANTSFPDINDTSSGGSGSTGASTGSTDTPSINTSGTPSTANSGAATGDTGTAAGGNTGAASGNTGSAAGGNTGAASGDTGSASGSTSGPQGGDIVSGGQHGHRVVVYPGSGSLGTVVLHDNGGGNYEFRNALLGGAVQPNAATLSGNHGHDVDPHTHSLGSHDHSLGSHTHDLASHTHTLGSHTHDLASHSHSLASHTHTLNNHTHSLSNHTHSLGGHVHSLAGHTHTLNNHTHTLSGHTHDLANHTHSLNSHTHTLSNHTHSLSNHIHDLSEAITALYGIFRDTAENTYDLTELQYRVNSGEWVSLSTAVAAGGGWYRLDLTPLVTDTLTLRPVQENNLLEIGPSGVVDKRVNIDAQLSVRSSIQAVLYAA